MDHGSFKFLDHGQNPYHHYIIQHPKRCYINLILVTVYPTPGKLDMNQLLSILLHLLLHRLLPVPLSTTAAEKHMNMQIL